MRHHPRCNGFNPMNPNQEASQEELDACLWCGPSSAGGGLLKNYPMEGKSEADLIAEYFPEVVRK